MSTEQNKPIVAVFDVPGVTAEHYDRIMKELEATGEGRPEGRLYHVASAQESGWFVVDVWESPELMNQFARDPRAHHPGHWRDAARAQNLSCARHHRRIERVHPYQVAGTQAR